MKKRNIFLWAVSVWLVKIILCNTANFEKKVSFSRRKKT